MPILDPIDLELWNEYFRAAITGMSADPTVPADQIVELSSGVADLAIDEYQERLTELTSK